MKFMQNGNLAKLVAFFVIAIIITCTVSFAANGWQSFINDPDSDKVADNKNPISDNVDENKDGNLKNEQEDVPTVAPTPKYYHSITGLETDFESSVKKPLCIVMSSTDPLYGISSSYLTVEIPTEYGATRLLAFTDSAQTLGKIGSIAPTRGYISNIADYFGGILLSYGSDDTFQYDYSLPVNSLDFAATPGYSYTEFNTLVYTNADLVSAFINNSKINTVSGENIRLPYDFVGIDENAPSSDKSATNVLIKYSDINTTELVYSSTENEYYLSKNATVKNDLLNDKSLSYDNVFILYADSTTHETADSTQMILNTSTCGKGVYISHGTLTEISWAKDASGDLVFTDISGNRLVINRGSSYIGFVKSSASASVKVS